MLYIFLSNKSAKKAFTLAELLIVLAVLGVITALTLSAVIVLRPDETKISYLKFYDVISEQVKVLSSNSSFFPTCQNNADCQDHPLINTAGRVSRMGYVIPNGKTKLCQLMAAELTAYSADTIRNACSNMDGYTYADDTFYNRAFHSPNGYDFTISTTLERTNVIEYQTDIYFDVNGNKGNNCIYNENTCPNPDRFKLMIAATGIVVPADIVGQKYLQTRTNLTKTKLDIPNGVIAVQNFLRNGLRFFTVSPCVANADDEGNPDAGNNAGANINPGHDIWDDSNNNGSGNNSNNNNGGSSGGSSTSNSGNTSGSDNGSSSDKTPGSSSSSSGNSGNSNNDDENTSSSSSGSSSGGHNAEASGGVVEYRCGQNINGRIINCIDNAYTEVVIDGIHFTTTTVYTHFPVTSDLPHKYGVSNAITIEMDDELWSLFKSKYLDKQYKESYNQDRVNKYVNASYANASLELAMEPSESIIVVVHSKNTNGNKNRIDLEVINQNSLWESSTDFYLAFWDMIKNGSSTAKMGVFPINGPFYIYGRRPIIDDEYYKLSSADTKLLNYLNELKQFFYSNKSHIIDIYAVRGFWDTSVMSYFYDKGYEIDQYVRFVGVDVPLYDDKYIYCWGENTLHIKYENESPAVYVDSSYKYDMPNFLINNLAPYINLQNNEALRRKTSSNKSMYPWYSSF